MAAMRLRCVVMLTVLAVLTLCKITNVAARGDDTEEPQLHGLDTPLITNQLRPRRRWPARLLKSAAASNLLHLPKSRFATVLTPQKITNNPPINRAKVVADLFDKHSVKDVNPQNFFKSEQFLSWADNVKAEYGVASERLMLSTLLKKLRGSSHGGVEAIIAQAFKSDDTRAIAIRFERLLLEKLLDGVRQNRYIALTDLMRYALYREEMQAVVHTRMQDKLGKEIPLFVRLSNVQSHLTPDKNDPFDNLERYFKMISHEKELSEVFKNLQHIDGFNNNAFLLNLLYEEAMAKTVNFARFMLTKLLKAKWTKDDIFKVLHDLEGQDIPYNLRDRLLDPMSTALEEDKLLIQRWGGRFL